ncbi:MAG: hypothetical protein CME38_02400 [Haliea sp.]|nr:hypothetical protein [Haliea sp.]|tara:strand:- start:1455 stop:2939 length:1485 start_codon:yes stop_codon:yes gene_type:complete
MARSNKVRGSVKSQRGKLHLYLYWRHPADPLKEYRWNIATGQEDTETNRELLKERLILLDAKIRGGAFFPCQEFPGTKIASYCPCASCSSTVAPMDLAHQAPRTLEQLFYHYEEHERARATGEDRKIEASSYRLKCQHMRALGQTFTWDDGDYLNEVEALTTYSIHELTPDIVQAWLVAFQNRQELLTEGKSPATAKYVNDLASIVRQALKYGQFRRWWRSHPLLDYEGQLVQQSKAERNRRMNQTLHKPFSLTERDRIIGYFRSQYEACPAGRYNGRDKPHRAMLYAYVVIGFNTGLRSPSEMTALEWSDVDFARKRIYVRKSREASGRVDEQIIRDYTKTVRHREVPMNDMVLEAFRLLQQYRQEDADWVFWNPRADTTNPFRNEKGWAPLTGEKRIRYPFEKCLASLGIPSPTNQGQYRMRHTFATLALDNTSMSDAKVAALIGDNVETMRKHYQGHCIQRWRDDDDTDQLNALNSIGQAKLAVITGGRKP